MQVNHLDSGWGSLPFQIVITGYRLLSDADLHGGGAQHGGDSSAPGAQPFSRLRDVCKWRRPYLSISDSLHGTGTVELECNNYSRGNKACSRDHAGVLSIERVMDFFLIFRKSLFFGDFRRSRSPDRLYPVPPTPPKTTANSAFFMLSDKVHNTL